MTERIHLSILGRRVGTFTGWDEIDTGIHCYYAVNAYSKLPVEDGDWLVDYGAGTVQVGESRAQHDLISVIGELARG